MYSVSAELVVICETDNVCLFVRRRIL